MFARPLRRGGRGERPVGLRGPRGEADSATEPPVAEWAEATGLVAMARLAAARAEARRARR